MFVSLIKRLVLLGIGVSGTLGYTFGALTAVQFPQLRAMNATRLMTRKSFFRLQPEDGIILQIIAR